jgi:ribosome-binding protein aMBF1 (putative translation factor)
VWRQIWPSDCAQLVRSVRLHCGIQQQVLAIAVGKKKAWLAKRELGAVRMTPTEGIDIVKAILAMKATETVEKNGAKLAILRELDKGPQG